MQKTLPAFAFTLFLSASCMFALQPMAGKMLLPLVGGTPAGWIVAMAFFQIMLLAGYLLAHLFSRFTPRGHALLYIATLGLGLPFLPVSMARHAGLLSGTPGPQDVFLLLTVVLAVPFIALSATSSTVQRLFTTTGHASARDPYFLYAASNLGSFLGLFAYPLLIEPSVSLTAQAKLWMGGYVLLIACALLCLSLSGKAATAAKPAKTETSSVSWRQRLEWTVLAFFPSSLLLGVTTFITTDIFSAPLIWVLPLGLYLLTFVAAFGKKNFIGLRALEALFPYAVGTVVIIRLFQMGLLHVTPWTLPALLLVFTAVALYCHMRLAAARPLGDNEKNLTEFYLFLSIGGALGGVMNAFIIPNVLNRAIEFPLVLLAALVLHPAASPRTVTGRIVLALVCASLFLTQTHMLQIGLAYTVVQYVLFIAMIGLVLSPDRVMILGMVLVFMVSEFALSPFNVLLTERNFFGVVKVYEQPFRLDGETLPARFMQHGTTTHGFQILDKRFSTTPTAYFTKAGPMGDVFALYKPRNVLVMGLGVGTLNCYSNPGNRFTFIEIDPAVIRAAQENFSYLSACKGSRPARLIAGDGRLELEKMKDEKFDLIIMDAFSSDTIPTHLITREALAHYLERLNKGGVIAINISNRYFRLQRAIATTAEGLGLQTRYVLRNSRKQLESYSFPSLWIVVAPKDAQIGRLEAQGWHGVDLPPGTQPWTDDHTNLLGALKGLDEK